MIPVLSREQMRDFDRYAIQQCRVPSTVLMENAGRGAAEVIGALLQERRSLGLQDARVVVVCGPGNNGGDGFVVARRLLGLGAAPVVYLTTSRDRLQGDAQLNCDAWQGVGGKVAELTDEANWPILEDALDDCDLAIDGLLGTGLDREVTGQLHRAIECINAASAPCVALDIPSGLDANRGNVLGVAIQALATVTFAHYKLGLLCTTGAELAGQVHVADIGVPAELCAKVGQAAGLLERSDVAELMTARRLTAHKAAAVVIWIAARWRRPTLP